MFRQGTVILSGSNRESASLESKVTSTPRTMSPAVSESPSVSSIGLEEAPMEVDSNVDVESSLCEESSSGQGQVSSLASLSLDNSHSEPPQKRARLAKEIQWKGFYSSLKPQRKDSLLFKLTAQPAEVESIVIEFIKSYVEDEEVGVVAILQLFVDLCGYKKLKVADHYKLANQHAESFMDKMVHEYMDSDLKKSGKFLFMKCSRFENVIDRIISKFLKELVVRGYECGLLFEKAFTSHVFEFLNLMAFSSVACIRVTGIILVIKFLTALIHLYRKFLPESEHESSRSSAELDEKRTEIESSIDFMYIIFEKNCLINDPKCSIVKVKCAQEMHHWLKAFPDIFVFKRKCLGRLMRLILDPHETVRRSALSVCEELVKDQGMAEVLTERIELCLKIVSTRFVDTNYKVAAKAIGVFTEAIESYCKYFIKSYKLAIIYRMFESHIVPAKAAGKFLARYLEHQQKEPEKVLTALVKIANLKKEFAGRLPHFLFSIVPFLPHLQNWDLVVNCLLNSQIAFSMRKRLLAVLNECARFACTGKFSKNRPTMFQEKGDSRKSEEIANAIIPNFRRLIVEFQTDKACLRQVTEMLSFINFEFTVFGDLQEHYLPIFNLLKELFKASTDVALLGDITSAFCCFSQRGDNADANAVIDGIKTSLVESLLEDLGGLSLDSSRTLLLRLRETSMKISIIFAKFNLTNILKWEDIFQVWGSDFLKVLKYLIVCCKWYLVWSFKQFIRAHRSDENGNSVNNLLYVDCKDFVYSCLELIQQNGRHGSSETFLIFEELCDLYAMFEVELRRKREFSHFVIQITESKYQEILMDFVAYQVIENTKLPLQQRQKYLSKIIDVLNMGVLPVDNFAKILQYYHTHHVEFGPILNQVLQDLSVAHPALPLLILHTLASVYKKILNRNRIVEIKSDESKQLQLLAKRFALLREMKSHNIVLKLVNMSITFAFTDEEYYPFLYFAKYFARLLNENGKSEALGLFKKMVPNKDKRNDILLLFAGVLKSIK